MLYAVNCALEPVSARSPVVLRGTIEENIRIAGEIGYDGLELFIRDPRQYDAARMKRLARESGLSYCFIATGLEYSLNRLCLIDDDASRRTAAVERLMEHIDLAAELGCGVVVGMMRGNIPDLARYDRYAGYFADAMRALSEHAGKCGVPLTVEAIMRYICNYLCSVPETAAFLRALGCQNVGLHIDSHLMNVEDPDIPGAIAANADLINYVHYSDRNRAYPGGGGFDFKAMTAALFRVGYSGFVTVESVPMPDPCACAKRAHDYMRAMETVAAIEAMDSGIV